MANIGPLKEKPIVIPLEEPTFDPESPATPPESVPVPEREPVPEGVPA